MSYIIKIIMAFFGGMGFSFLFNIRRTKLLITSFGSAIGWAVYTLIKLYVSDSDVFGFFIGAVVVTIYAEIFARIKKTPTTTYLVVGIIPMIPGGSLYHTMNYAFIGDWENFSVTGMYTLQLAMALAVGIIVVSSVMTMANAVTHKIKAIKKN